MALKVVGSNPIIHPRKGTRLDTISSLVFLFYVGMMPVLGCYSNFFRYIDFCGSIYGRILLLLEDVKIPVPIMLKPSCASRLSGTAGGIYLFLSFC